jgi:ankyrin repeat protein
LIFPLFPFDTSVVENTRGHTMRAALIALLLMFGSQAAAECGNLCDGYWWSISTAADLQAELNGGAEVMARDKHGDTPLHGAAECSFCEAGVIQALLDSVADAKAKNKDGRTPWDLAQKNEKLKGTKAYWALNDAHYN